MNDDGRFTACVTGRRVGALSRRHLFRAAGAGIALPFLDAMVPVFGHAARAASAVPPRRMVAIHVPLGWMPRFFFPAKPDPSKPASGSAPVLPSSPYLDLLQDHRGLFTAFSGLSHPDCGSGHGAGPCFLTGARSPNSPTFRNTQSADQFVRAAGLGIRLDVPDEVPATPLSGRVRHNLFLIVREAVNNAVKHAQATLVRLSVRLDTPLDGGRVTITVEDDGRGFDPNEPADDGRHSGLANMRRRAEDIGGTLTLTSRPGSGTRVEITAPLA